MNCGCEAIVNYGVSMFVKHCPRHSEENVANLEFQSRRTEETVLTNAVLRAALARLVQTSATVDRMHLDDRVDDDPDPSFNYLTHWRAAIAAAEEAMRE